ncbi:hypothetical protein CHH28_09175 [Bacterioplanes sanyensis]|uniref:Uncharacterized protein n=1 Tax=Bacterioplanes sanyensis TaxID=1249553 RepID=A0A222FKC8_9GAMM|nr:hypothetical protein [Bacterioplanes sanyensis]ASP38841.1 hypothetical protein CHH28_09175 [Bacterioplanes sanyensis]
MKAQRGSGAIGFMMLLPVLMVVILTSLEVGRVLLIRALLIEGVADSSRMLQLSEPLATSAELQQRWQQWAQDMPLLSAVQLQQLDYQAYASAGHVREQNEGDDPHTLALRWRFDIELLSRQSIALQLQRHVIWERRP